MMSDSEIAAIARRVAEAANVAGYPWMVPEDVPGYGAFIDGPDGMRLLIQPDRTPGKLVIEGIYPRSEATRGESRSIGVGASRDPAAIVREINNRLLPGYRSELERVRLMTVSYQADAKGRAEVLAGVGALFGAQPFASENGYQHVLTLTGMTAGTGSVVMSGAPELMDIKLHDIPKAIAFQVLEALAQVNTGQRPRLRRGPGQPAEVHRPVIQS